MPLVYMEETQKNLITIWKVQSHHLESCCYSKYLVPRKAQVTRTWGIRKDCFFHIGPGSAESPPKAKHPAQVLLMFYTYVLLDQTGLVQSRFWFLTSGWYKRQDDCRSQNHIRAISGLRHLAAPFLSAFLPAFPLTVFSQRQRCWLCV